MINNKGEHGMDRREFMSGAVVFAALGFALFGRGSRQ